MVAEGVAVEAVPDVAMVEEEEEFHQSFHGRQCDNIIHPGLGSAYTTVGAGSFFQHPNDVCKPECLLQLWV
jgi:hypothetical protein